jgi:two-component sensor histidine kinase
MSGKPAVTLAPSATGHQLMHRNRNLFAIVSTLAGQTLSRAGVDSGITSSFAARVRAKAHAQELITLDERQTISLRRLSERVLMPVAPEVGRLVIRGPGVGIPGGHVSGFALVLHELGTNALKYGAWSNDTGRVALCREPVSTGLSMTWREQGGPVITEPPSTNHGLGSVLIEAAIPQAKVERHFNSLGLEVIFDVPLEQDDNIEPTMRPKGSS